MHYIHALSFVLHGKFNRFEVRWTKQPNYKELTVQWIPLVTSSVRTRTRLQQAQFFLLVLRTNKNNNAGILTFKLCTIETALFVTPLGRHLPF